MKSLLFVVFCMCTLLEAYAQDVNYKEYKSVTDDRKSVVLKEDFSDNRNSWPEYDDEDDYSQMKNGLFVVQTKTALATSYLKEFMLGEDADFEIELQLKMIEGTSKSGQMLVWGADKTDNSYNFSLNAQGEYSISKYVGTYSFLVDWTKLKVFNVTIPHKLSVRKIANTLYFFLDEVFVNQIPYAVRFGNEFGFQVAGNSKIEVDFFYISQLLKKKQTTIAVPQQPASSPIENTNAVVAPQNKPTVASSNTIGFPQIHIILPELQDNTAYTTTNFVVLKFAVEAPAGVQSVFIDKEALPLNAENEYVKIKELLTQQSEVILNVTDKEGRTTQKKINLSKSVAPINPTYHALFIGENEYIDRNINSLDNPVSDCEHVIQVLTSRYTFQQENIIFLKNATRNDISNAFDKLLTKLSPQDNLLIFYAGHGVWDEQLRKGFWLPTDAQRNNRGTWFSNSELRDYISGIKAKHVLLVADACFGGGIFKTRDAFSKMDIAIAELNKFPSRKAMTSGAMNTVPDKSVFVEYMVKRLEQNEEKYLPAEQLFSSFKTAVINNSPVSQIPQYGEIKESGDEGGDFIFIRK